MNKHDIKLLRLNYELQKFSVEHTGIASTFDISSSCWARFGTFGMTVHKYKGGRWCEKHVNGWRTISADECIEKLNNMDWEEEN